MTEVQSERQPEKRSAAQKGATGLLAVFAVLLMIAVVVWLVGDDEGSSQGPRAPEAVSTTELSDTASSSAVPVYWAGEQAGATLELSGAGGGTYVRYLTGGAEPGDPRADFLTVGSYEFADPVAALEKLSRQPDGVRRTVPGRGVAYFNRTDPQNVYLAYPDVDVQIEVYDPDPSRAKELVTSGRIVPVN